jgi:hypothetical protein
MTSKTRIKNWWSKLESTRYEVTTSTYFAKIESNSKQVCSDNYLHLARSGAVGGPSGWAGARGGRASHHVAGSRGVGGSPRGARHLVAEAWGRGPLGGGSKPLGCRITGSANSQQRRRRGSWCPSPRGADCDISPLKEGWSVLIRIITGCHYWSNDL